MEINQRRTNSSEYYWCKKKKQKKEKCTGYRLGSGFGLTDILELQPQRFINTGATAFYPVLLLRRYIVAGDVLLWLAAFSSIIYWRSPGMAIKVERSICQHLLVLGLSERRPAGNVGFSFQNIAGKSMQGWWIQWLSGCKYRGATCFINRSGKITFELWKLHICSLKFENGPFLCVFTIFILIRSRFSLCNFSSSHSHPTSIGFRVCFQNKTVTNRLAARPISSVEFYSCLRLWNTPASCLSRQVDPERIESILKKLVCLLFWNSWHLQRPLLPQAHIQQLQWEHLLNGKAGLNSSGTIGLI